MLVLSHRNRGINNGFSNMLLNPFMPTGAFNICCPRDCVSRHNGGPAGAPLKPLRDDSALTPWTLRHLVHTLTAPTLGNAAKIFKGKKCFTFHWLVRTKSAAKIFILLLKNKVAYMRCQPRSESNILFLNTCNEPMQ